MRPGVLLGVRMRALFSLLMLSPSRKGVGVAAAGAEIPFRLGVAMVAGTKHSE